MEKEIRSLNIDDAPIKVQKRGRVVEGRAIVFNKESKPIQATNGTFIEEIKPSAVDGLIQRSDVLALLDHDQKRGILARSRNGEGSLDLWVDDNGLNYRFESPNTALGDELLEGIRRRDITTSSFTFMVGSGGQRWEKRSDGVYKRTITQFDILNDVSPVYREAYEDTSVACRSLEEAIKDMERIPDNIVQETKPEERKEEEKTKPEDRKEEEKLLEIDTKAEPKKPTFKELEDYYGNIQAKINQHK